jgi:hypothetical protein
LFECKPASSQLDFVDLFFLDAKVLSEDRTPQKLARWLSGSDAALKIAVETREHVERLAEKFGPDARLIGGLDDALDLGNVFADDVRERRAWPFCRLRRQRCVLDIDDLQKVDLLSGPVMPPM